MIYVDDLHFSYDKENEVINGISLSIDKGKKYAFVGKSEKEKQQPLEQEAQAP